VQEPYFCPKSKHGAIEYRLWTIRKNAPDDDKKYQKKKTNDSVKRKRDTGGQQDEEDDLMDENMLGEDELQDQVKEFETNSKNFNLGFRGFLSLCFWLFLSAIDLGFTVESGPFAEAL